MIDLRDVFDKPLTKFIKHQLTDEPQFVFADGKEAWIRIDDDVDPKVMGLKRFRVEVHADGNVFIGILHFKDVEVQIQTIETKQEWEARQDQKNS